MQGGINKLGFSTKIGINKISANFSTPLNFDLIMEPEQINEIIIKWFSHDVSLRANARKILGELGKYCYEVSISPQLKVLKYSYTITVKK